MLTLKIMDQLYFNKCLFPEFMQLMASELSLKGFPLCIATGISSMDFFFFFLIETVFYLCIFVLYKR